MSRIYSVERLLNAEQLKEFIALSQRRTIDELHEWMLSRGLKICRTAVGNYLRRIRRQMAARFMPQIDGMSDSEKRRQLSAWAAALGGEPLVAMLRFAAYQINLQAAAESWSAERVKALSLVIRRRRKGASKRV